MSREKIEGLAEYENSSLFSDLEKAVGMPTR
jgi:hypothetical protein